MHQGGVLTDTRATARSVRRLARAADMARSTRKPVRSLTEFLQECVRVLDAIVFHTDPQGNEVDITPGHRVTEKVWFLSWQCRIVDETPYPTCVQHFRARISQTRDTQKQKSVKASILWRSVHKKRPEEEMVRLSCATETSDRTPSSVPTHDGGAQEMVRHKTQLGPSTVTSTFHDENRN